MATISYTTGTEYLNKTTSTSRKKHSLLFKTIIKAIQDKKGEHIVSLDLRNVPEAVADFFIICEASSTTQIKAIADNVEHLASLTCGEYPYKLEGQQNAQWILTDYVDIVVHIMHTEARKFYKLEEMWCDAPLTGHDTDNF